MEVYTVSCHGGQLKAHRSVGEHTHPLLIPQFLSCRLQPSIPLLVFISASVMRTKESTHSFALSLTSSPSPAFSLSWSLRARLAGLISNCDLTAWWKDWQTCTNTHILYEKKGDQGQFCQAQKPLEQGPETMRGLERRRREFCLF